MGGKTLLVLAIGLFFIFLPYVSAGILIGQPDKFYNIGDTLKVQVILTSGVSANDFLTLNLVCNSAGVEIYKSPFNLEPGEEVTIDVVAVLSKSLIGELRGDCSLVAGYGADSAVSQGFTITNEITIEMQLEGNKYNPGDNILIAGILSKKSGSTVSGIVEANIDSLGLYSSKPVNGDSFSFEFLIPPEAKSGQHVLNIRVYEENNLGGISNEGSAVEVIDISQIFKKLDIVLSEQNVVPGNEIVFVVNALDQAEEAVNTEIRLEVWEPEEVLFIDKVISQGEENRISIGQNFKPGYWRIQASAEEMSKRKLFYVEKVEKIESALVGNSLTTKNVGNVPFEGPVEVKIGGESRLIQVKLKVGETKTFKLKAPEGSYDISVNDGSGEVSLGSTLLTGRAVDVKNANWGLSGDVDYKSPLFFFMVAVILLLGFGCVQIIRVKKRKASNLKKTKPVPAKVNPVLSGRREEASVVAVKIEKKENSPFIEKTIKEAFDIAKKSRGRIYADSSYNLVIFSPSLLGLDSSENVAVKTAKNIEQILKHGKTRTGEKFRFGIGVSKGRIISEVRQGEFDFTTTDNMVSKAKNLAHGLDGMVLLTEEMQKAIIQEIKTEKLPDREAWKIIKISDRSQHEEFLRGFSQRNK